MTTTSSESRGSRPPAGRDELLIYLDFDGVAHHHEVWWHPRRGAYIKADPSFVLFQHTALLVDVLVPYPSVRIVLSTSWVRHYSYSKAVRRLPDALRKRVVGATYHREMNASSFDAKPRGIQVLEDVQRRQPRDWLAIDDDDEGWPDCCRSKLVRSHAEMGISDPDVLRELREKLAAMHTGAGAG
ncbi:HAD domain-containing protein [Variovorax ureilyticus]|uniref:HAD domain-containing protein n=1 Tax=Variovorax ureilyticus TaxID=1836198 RepID=UPI003D672A53